MAAPKNAHTNNRTSSTGTRSSGRSTTQKSTGNTGTAGKTTRTSRIIDDDDEKALSPERRREIIFFVYLAVSVFMLCSNFGICGAVGRVFSGFFFGLIGWSQYLVPFYLFFTAAFLLSNGPKKSVVRRVLWVGAILILTSWVFQLIAGVEEQTIKTLYMTGYTDHRGGGVILGGIMILLCKLIGKVGIIILTVLLSIVSVIQVTGVSVIDLVKKIFTFNYRDKDEDEEDDEEDEGIYDDVEYVSSVRTNPKSRPNMLNTLEVLPEEEESRGKKKKRLGGGDRKALPGGKAEEKKTLSSDEMQEIHQDPADDPFTDKTGAYREELADLDNLKEAARRKAMEADSVNWKEKKDTGLPEKKERGVVPVSEDRGLTIPNENTVGSTVRNYRREGNFPDRKDPGQTLPDQDRQSETPVDFFELKPGFEDPIDHSWNGSFTAKPVDTYPDQGDLPDYGAGVRASQADWTDRGAGQSPADRSPRRTASTTGSGHASRTEGSGGFSGLTAEDLMAVERAKAQAEGERVTHNDTLIETARIQQGMAAVAEEPKKKPYKLPPVSLLNASRSKGNRNDSDIRETAMKLKQTMESFGVNVTITDYSRGPAVTRFEMTPETGVKVSKILSLQDDIKLNLAAVDIRIEAPIPGKAAIGIEVPNKEVQSVSFRELVENDSFKNAKSKISFALGKDIGGQLIVGDIAKMPHMLIAGATGSGKSVCINTIIMSILYKAKPDEVRMIMVDPKQVELTAYNGIPHMLIPVVTDAKKAAGALNWAVQEMEKRYKLFARYNVRNLEGFNKKVEEMSPIDPEDMEKNADLRFMPQIVVVVDELADLMMVAHGEVEDAIVRLSQLARAAGIHLIIATQRPSVDVITGLIKANVPSRIAFAVSSGTDSRTILDMVGAEKLLGKGDMLYYPTGFPKPVRVQGAFVSDDEVVAVTDYIKNQCGEASYDSAIEQSISSGAATGSSGGEPAEEDSERYDEYFEEAGRLVIEKDKASIGHLQRVFRIGFNRAARIMDQLADAGVVGPEEGTKPRKILMTMDEFEEFMSL